MTLRAKKKSGKDSEIKIRTVFARSSLFFAFFSFFGVYRYKIYSLVWFLLFFVYEALFYVGLSSPKLVIFNPGANSNKMQREFLVTTLGEAILWVVCVLSVISFMYFIFLYRRTLGAFTFGEYTAFAFQKGRSKLEKITLLFMQIGGDCAFLILSADKSNRHNRLKKLSHFTLFLPGMRFLLMGSRFMIAVEFLMLFTVKWPALQTRLKFSAEAKMKKRLVLLIAVLLGIAFLYLFASRAIYYTALERKSFEIGDMSMKPFWEKLYNRTNGKIDFLCTASDYLGESPYVFAYYCKYKMPENIAWGLLTLRPIIQIIGNLGLGVSYSSLTEDVASGQYSGFAYTLIADFGVVGSLIAAFLFGCLFAQIEQQRKYSAVCATLYPPVKVMCFFAPVYYFHVGRLDFTILFCLLLTPICLKRRQRYDCAIRLTK